MTTLDKMLQGLANALGASLTTLTTTAKTVVGAINELKSGLTSTTNTVSGHTSTIGSGTLNTTNKTLIAAINELAAKSINLNQTTFAVDDTRTAKTLVTPTKSGTMFLFLAGSGSANYLINKNYCQINSGATDIAIIKATDEILGFVLVCKVTSGTPVTAVISRGSSSFTANVYYVIL